ncbi:MAG: Crp/Fnr family transcriptional regulator [Anaerolineae bacterium]
MTTSANSGLHGARAAILDNVLTHDLPPVQQQTIVDAARVRTAARGAFFVRQGADAICAYVLVSGHAKLTQITADGDELLLRYLLPGDAFGLVAVLRRTTYPINVKAVDDCQALAWDRQTLLALMERYPALSLNATRVLGERMRELQERLQDLTTKHVEGRLAQTLQRLARQLGEPVAGGILINIPLPREDLAEMTGSTTFTVSRIISRWEHEGIIEARREHLLIRAPHALVRIAEDLG